MRQQAMENLLVLTEQAVVELDNHSPASVGYIQARFNLDNLMAKSRILRSRKNDASVLRELINA